MTRRDQSRGSAANWFNEFLGIVAACLVILALPIEAARAQVCGALCDSSPDRAAILKILGFAPIWPNFDIIENATGQSDTTQFLDLFAQQTSFGGGPAHLGMYVSSTTGADVAAFGGADYAHSSGYGVTDSAGLLGPGGTSGPSFKDVDGGGGIEGSYNLASLMRLPADQRFDVEGFFNYDHNAMTLGALPGIGVANSGSAQTNTYMVGGLVSYAIERTYLNVAGFYDFGGGSEFQTTDGSAGSFGLQGYGVDARLGNTFILYNSITPGTQGFVTKEPATPAGGYAVGLDASGHVGYGNQRFDSFTDSTGFIYGPDQTRFGDAGALAKLFVVFAQGDYLWAPYVGASIDQQFAYSSTLDIPSQPALVGGDVLFIRPAQTYYGPQLGLDMQAPSGWKAGIKGFLTATADTQIAGGTVYASIPFDVPPPPAPPLAAKY